MVTWIVSQRILIRIHGNYVQDHELLVNDSSSNPGLTETAGKYIRRTFVPRHISAPRDITNVMQDQLNSSAKDETGTELDVQVQIEQAVVVDYNPIILETTAENRGLPGNENGVLPKGPRDHLGERNRWEFAR